jgi:hypothetical protein
VVSFPLVAQLSNGLVLAIGNEDRVEAEAAGASRFFGDPARQDSCAAVFGAVG